MAKVKKIPATISRVTAEPPGTVKKRKVAGYARVSTDNEEQQTSCEAQMDYYSKYIASRDDWEFVKMYSDEGISATSTKHRAGFNAMIDDALAGKIDLIITKSISRFARNTVDSLTAIRKLKENGTEVFFEKKYMRTGGNPLFSRDIRLFLCRFVAYLSLKSAKGNSMILQEK